MDDSLSVPVSLPLDGDNFLRRECPSCEQQFKWFSHPEGDTDMEAVDQYFCPLCGLPAGIDSWWTPDQLEYMHHAAGPDIDQFVQDTLNDAFKGIKGVSYKADPNFTLGLETPDPLVEPDDMTIVEPPCHPNEPLKVPEHATEHIHCLVCGSAFAT